MRSVTDLNLLASTCTAFCGVLERHCPYIVVSGFVAIASGRSRGTEDIDFILEKISKERFVSLHADLEKSGFECIQGHDPIRLYDDYLADRLSLRYIRKNQLLPDMEVKLAKDHLDEYQLKNRVKLPLTGLDVWFGSVNVNIAFKEELLKSDKDIEDALHLRKVYSDLINEKEINKVKYLIKQWRL